MKSKRVGIEVTLNRLTFLAKKAIHPKNAKQYLSKQLKNLEGLSSNMYFLNVDLPQKKFSKEDVEFVQSVSRRTKLIVEAEFSSSCSLDAVLFFLRNFKDQNYLTEIIFYEDFLFSLLKRELEELMSFIFIEEEGQNYLLRNIFNTVNRKSVKHISDSIIKLSQRKDIYLPLSLNMTSNFWYPVCRRWKTVEPHPDFSFSWVDIGFDHNSETALNVFRILPLMKKELLPLCIRFRLEAIGNRSSLAFFHYVSEYVSICGLDEAQIICSDYTDDFFKPTKYIYNSFVKNRRKFKRLSFRIGSHSSPFAEWDLDLCSIASEIDENWKAQTINLLRMYKSRIMNLGSEWSTGISDYFENEYALIGYIPDLIYTAPKTKQALD
eukprot:snap_masked-scaffold_10-processed-gene-11.24-mRNA-1 protein AED:1.00 eAED:1.00 QI:0/-1/0/0/-1/1/1/0/378